MNLAIELYRDEKIDLSKAAEIAGLSIAELENQLIKE
jgi:predicted HTH domain antitoxin